MNRARTQPMRVIAKGFGLLILIGTLLLSTPWASSGPEGLRLIDALFTATSATCVTGLVVVNTAYDLSWFGQVVVLFLIQCGGMGLMIFTTMLYQFLGVKMSFRQRSALQAALNQDNYQNMAVLAKQVFGYTLLLEGVGALLLTLRFWGEYGLVGGLWRGIFHAVSAFNNAGFDVFGNSLESYAGDFYVNAVIIMLIICGGLGFVVISELVQRKPRNFHQLCQLSLQSKVVLLMTSTLILAGTVIIALVEWQNPATLGTMPPHEKLLAALFQSVTCRTAGYNSIPLADITPSGALMMMFLMFIGASPGSTGGGIKTTTFGILVLAVASIVGGRDDLVVMGRQISPATVLKALAVLMLSALVVAGSILILSFDTDISLMALSFEVVSAFSTTGLSMGITAALSDGAKILLTALMFIGRTGPLTLAIALSKPSKTSNLRYPKGKIMIG